jgi:hypothetical protein
MKVEPAFRPGTTFRDDSHCCWAGFNNATSFLGFDCSKREPAGLDGLLALAMLI